MKKLDPKHVKRRMESLLRKLDAIRDQMYDLRLRCSHTGMRKLIVMTNSDGTARVIINECSACGLNIEGETP